MLLGNSPAVDLVGIAVGHLYFFLDDVFPYTRAGRGRRPLRTPAWLRQLSGLNVGASLGGRRVAEAGLGHVVQAEPPRRPPANPQPTGVPQPAEGQAEAVPQDVDVAALADT